MDLGYIWLGPPCQPLADFFHLLLTVDILGFWGGMKVDPVSRGDSLFTSHHLQFPSQIFAQVSSVVREINCG